MQVAVKAQTDAEDFASTRIALLTDFCGYLDRYPLTCVPSLFPEGVVLLNDAIRAVVISETPFFKEMMRLLRKYQLVNAEIHTLGTVMDVLHLSPRDIRILTSRLTKGRQTLLHKDLSVRIKWLFAL